MKVWYSVSYIVLSLLVWFQWHMYLFKNVGININSNNNKNINRNNNKNINSNNNDECETISKLISSCTPLLVYTNFTDLYLGSGEFMWTKM